MAMNENINACYMLIPSFLNLSGKTTHMKCTGKHIVACGFWLAAMALKLEQKRTAGYVIYVSYNLIFFSGKFGSLNCTEKQCQILGRTNRR